MLSIYNYLKINDFLKDAWQDKRAKNNRFSIRAWAHQMGLKHHNALYEMVNGKRKVPKSLVLKLIKSLELNVQEAQYLELLIDLSRAKNKELQDSYLEKMRPYQNKRTVKFLELDSFKMLQDPIHFFIGELALQKDFVHDAQWIQNRLNYPASISQINAAIERLVALDILRFDVNDKIHRIDQHIQSKSDDHDQALKDYHKSIMHLAEKAIDTQDVMIREFQGMAINMDVDRMDEAKKMIREFVNQFVAEFDTPKVKNEEVYQLNLQFFGITKKPNESVYKN